MKTCKKDMEKDLGDERTEVNARGLMADSGEIMVASRAIIETTWNDRPKFDRPDFEYSPPAASNETSEDYAPIKVGVPRKGGSRRSRGTRRRPHGSQQPSCASGLRAARHEAF